MEEKPKKKKWLNKNIPGMGLASLFSIMNNGLCQK